MAIPPGKTWKEHYNDQITELVRIRDQISAVEDFEGHPDDFASLEPATRTKIAGVVQTRFTSIRAELLAVLQYLQNP